MANDRNEPSMEAILSSIKKIIADEDRSRAISSRRPARDTRRDEQADDEDILELTEAAGDGETATDGDEAELLDTQKAQSLRQSFSVLQTLSEPAAAPQIVRSGETSLEALTRELMRPMLKDWLDANLPGIVEAMVAREIERITKKG